MNRTPLLPDDWRRALDLDSESGLLGEIYQTMADSYRRETIYPKAEDVWKAFELCPFEEVRIVVLGQDPYHGFGQAHGLAFSVPKGLPEPPSLRNIFKEFVADTGFAPPPSGDLSNWARQGMLLLNTALTVRAGSPGSHADGRWDPFVNRVLEVLNGETRPIVFWLWGAHAQKRGDALSNPHHLVLRSAHPSPLGAYRGFWGSKPF
ncbi:MAG: uracil-DNA glycosylase, partial [Bacteroidia bacterium]